MYKLKSKFSILLAAAMLSACGGSNKEVLNDSVQTTIQEDIVAPKIKDISLPAIGNSIPKLYIESEPGAHVTVLANGKAATLGPAHIISRSGKAEIPLIAIFEEGEYDITVTVEDDSGNQTTYVNEIQFVLDRNIITPVLEFANVTNNKNPKIEVTAEPFSKIDFFVGIELQSTFIVDDQGKAEVNLENLTDGEYVLFARSVDSAGNTAESETRILTIDTVATAPVITSPALSKTNSPDIQIRGEAGSRVDFALNGETLESKTIDSSGIVSFKLTNLADGNHSYQVRVTDLAGNSASSGIQTITVDTAIAAPTLTFTALTNDTTPNVIVSGENSASVVLTVDGQALPAQTLVSGSATFTLPVQADGTHSLQATVTDAAGNTAASGVQTITIDSEIAVPTLSFGALTNTPTPDILVFGEAGASVVLAVDGQALPAQTIVSGSVTFTLPAQADGAHSLQATVTDAAGNTASSAAETIEIDSTIATPTLSFTALTNDTTPEVLVSGEEGASVVLSVNGSALPAQTITAGSASFTLPAQADGSYSLQASITDAAGNSASSTAETITIDSVIAAPTLTFTALTNDTTPTVIVSGEAGASVVLTVDGQALPVQTLISGSATFTLPAQTDGAHSLQATATDAAGNTAASSVQTITIQTDVAPYIVAFSPENNETNVLTDEVVGIEFSESINTATLNSSTFYLQDQSSNNVVSSVVYDTDTNIAMLLLNSNLGIHRTYTATAKSSIADLSGNTIGSDFSWSFSTGEGSFQAPTISNLIPASQFGYFQKDVFHFSNGDKLALVSVSDINGDATFQYKTYDSQTQAWSNFFTIDTFSGADLYFDADQSGDNVIAVYSNSNYATGLVKSTQYSNQTKTFSSAEIIDGVSNMSIMNDAIDVSINDSGKAVVIYASFQDGLARVSFYDANSGWSSPENISISTSFTDSDATFSIDLNNKGEAITAWYAANIDYSNPGLVKLYMSYFDGISWSPTSQLYSVDGGMMIASPDEVVGQIQAHITDSSYATVIYSDRVSDDIHSIFVDNAVVGLPEKVNSIRRWGNEEPENIFRSFLDESGKIEILFADPNVDNAVLYTEKLLNGSFSPEQIVATNYNAEFSNNNIYAAKDLVTGDMTLIIKRIESFTQIENFSYQRRINDAWTSETVFSTNDGSHDYYDLGIKLSIDQSTGHLFLTRSGGNFIGMDYSLDYIETVFK